MTPIRNAHGSKFCQVVCAKSEISFIKPDKVSCAIKAENILPFHIMAR